MGFTTHANICCSKQLEAEASHGRGEALPLCNSHLALLFSLRQPASIIQHVQWNLLLSCRTGRMGPIARTSGSTGSSVGGLEEYRPVVNSLPELTHFLLGQERACQGLLDVLQDDVPGHGLPQVVNLCGQTGSGMFALPLHCPGAALGLCTSYDDVDHSLLLPTPCLPWTWQPCLPWTWQRLAHDCSLLLQGRSAWQ